MFYINNLGNNLTFFIYSFISGNNVQVEAQKPVIIKKHFSQPKATAPSGVVLANFEDDIKINDGIVSEKSIKKNEPSRGRKTKEQKSCLRYFFEECSYFDDLPRELQQKLLTDTGLTVKSVKDWFAQERVKEKRLGNFKGRRTPNDVNISEYEPDANISEYETDVNETQHEEKHDTDESAEVFPCSLCGMEFNTSDKWKRHEEEEEKQFNQGFKQGLISTEVDESHDSSQLKSVKGLSRIVLLSILNCTWSWLAMGSSTMTCAW